MNRHEIFALILLLAIVFTGVSLITMYLISSGAMNMLTLFWLLASALIL